MINHFNKLMVNTPCQGRGPIIVLSQLLVGGVFFLVSSAVAADTQQPAYPNPVFSANQQVTLPEVLTDFRIEQAQHVHQTHQPIVIYQPQDIQMPTLHNWVESNAKVQAIGGWMFYASEEESSLDPHLQQQTKPNSVLKPMSLPSAAPVKEQP